MALAAVTLARPRVAPPARHVRAPVPPAVEGPCGSAQQALALAMAQARAALALARAALVAAARARPPRVALAAAAVEEAQVALALAQALAPASSQRSTAAAGQIIHQAFAEIVHREYQPRHAGGERAMAWQWHLRQNSYGICEGDNTGWQPVETSTAAQVANLSATIHSG